MYDFSSSTVALVYALAYTVTNAPPTKNNDCITAFELLMIPSPSYPKVSIQNLVISKLAIETTANDNNGYTTLNNIYVFHIPLTMCFYILNRFL